MKPKIALIVDVYDWAFYNRAMVLKEKLSDYYDFKIIPADSALDNNILQTILLVQDCDLVHFFWRRLLFHLSDDDYIFKRNQIKVKEFIEEKLSHIAVTSCVPDHVLLDEENLEKNKDVLNFVDNYYVLSQKLWDIYVGLGCQKPYGIIIGGVDLTKFKPNSTKKIAQQKKFVIGWSGNSKWGGEEYKEDLKGVHTILIPAVEELQKENYPVELKLADKNEKLIPIEDMPDYYRSIDLYVCTSKTEGGPYPVLEAMASGIPIISTDVGFVNQVLGEKQKHFLLEERSISCLKEKIKELIENPEKLEELARENLTQIKQYNYDEVIDKFRNFFDDSLKKKGVKNKK